MIASIGFPRCPCVVAVIGTGPPSNVPLCYLVPDTAMNRVTWNAPACAISSSFGASSARPSAAGTGEIDSQFPLGHWMRTGLPRRWQ
ncbi:putative diguanylate cyclase (GGDEF) domain protein [Thioalkalivibrio nitratireducens DSM 14787]|uniref:Diguanylate cyclase (GGDEF) domain protein n=1 Tax=Thioalkalivibrio nitratireducens (strain DSM 14787 / UNIQEM 213 / ALEN2) TaxID=1255043 RepID=L0DRY0_THIND|nr:putative diguanylate cyclase (GGDEF) domain protein [Thioalkalivibrio nitratireducens DSM 14787]